MARISRPYDGGAPGGEPGSVPSDRAPWVACPDSRWRMLPGVGLVVLSLARYALVTATAGEVCQPDHGRWWMVRASIGTGICPPWIGARPASGLQREPMPRAAVRGRSRPRTRALARLPPGTLESVRLGAAESVFALLPRPRLAPAPPMFDRCQPCQGRRRRPEGFSLDTAGWHRTSGGRGQCACSPTTVGQVTGSGTRPTRYVVGSGPHELRAKRASGARRRRSLRPHVSP